MASNVTAQSVLEKISVDHLECSICTNRFRQPKLLDCLHSFCLQCLHDLRQSQDPSSTKLTCPLCRRETMLKGSGVADLPNNFAFSALVEEVTMQEKLLKGQGSEITCQNCDEENQAISRCMDCDHFLCQECQKAHGRMTVMKSHKIYTLAQLRSGEIVYKSKLREEVPKCGIHPDQNLNVYCDECENIICTTCSVIDHMRHLLITVPKASERSKGKVEEMVAKTEKTTETMMAIIQETHKSRKKLDTMFTDAKGKITKKADKEVVKIQQEVAKIRQEEQKLLTETEKIYQERVSTIEAVQARNTILVDHAKHTLDEVKQLAIQASCYEIVELQEKLLYNLSELTGKQPEQVPDKLTFMDFEEGERSLGKLTLEDEPKAAARKSARPGRSSGKVKWGRRNAVTNTSDWSLGGLTLEPQAAAQQSLRPRRSCVKEKWELKTEVTNFGLTNAYLKHVAALSNNKILAVSTCEHGCKVFTVTMPKSQHAPFLNTEWLQISGLTDDVRDTVVNKDDKLLALDGRVVKVFNKQHQLLHQFTPCRGSDSTPTCLAVDDSNLIAVGHRGKKEISLHNPDGSLIRRLPAPMIGYYLTMHNHRLFYTTHLTKKLVCVDYYGATVFSVGMDSELFGVCCGSDGSVYVAVHRYPTGDILHYSPEGRYIGCVIKDCSHPYGITLTSNGDLVVAAGKSVKIFH